MDEEGFTKKSVEQPILGPEIRSQIAPGLSDRVFTPVSFYKENKIYFWAIGLGVIIIGLLAYFAFRKAPAPPVVEAKVKIDIQAPNTVPSGGEVVYRISVENQDSQKLVALQLELTYPSGFTYISSDQPAQNLSGTLFNAPDLLPSQNVAAVIVKAKAAGNVNDVKQLLVKLHYKYSNFNSEFTKQESFSVRLAASDIFLELGGPTNVNNAQLVTYTIKYQNNSQEAIKNARIQFTFPDGFNAASSDPQPDLGNNIWNIPTLPPGGSGSISVQGNFQSANPNESKNALAELLILGSDGQFYVQASSPFATAITSLPLQASQEFRSQDASNSGVVNPGDNLNFVVKYQNNASTVANAVNIVVNLDSKALDFSSLRAEAGQVSGSSILWNAATVPALEHLSPSATGQLSFSIKLKNPAVSDASKNLSVVSKIKIKSDEYETYFPGNDLTLKIASPANITGIVAYVSGSLPPQAGKTTVYKVGLSLRNATNDFTNTVLTAYLPLAPGAFDSSSISGSEQGKVDFDPATGKLTWRVGNLPAHIGQFSQPRSLQFNVSLAASVTQVNQSPVLVKNITLQAQDLFTNQQVAATAEDLTTQDASNSGGAGGQVVP